MKKIRNKKTIKPTFHITKGLRWTLVLSQTANILVFISELSSWMLALLALCLLWQVFIITKEQKNPPSILLLLLSISGAVAIALSGQQLGLLVSMIHLVCFAYIMKTLEMNRRRDFYQVILLGVFLLSCSLIFKQNLLFSSLIFILLIFNFVVLFLYFSRATSSIQAYKKVSLLLLQSIPLALVLFFIFPRLSPFWQVPLAKSAKTGLSDHVQPGDIAKLAQSDELAFRVTFENGAPLPSTMYWRALTMEHFDGKKWAIDQPKNNKGIPVRNTSRKIDRQFSRNLSLSLQGPSYQYQVIAEPSFQTWLFALDIAQVNTSSVMQLADYSLIYHKPITNNVSYQVNSFWQSPMQLDINNSLLESNLHFPNDANPRLQREALKLREIHSDDRALINDVLSRFRQQQYFYTLQPPRLINNSLDQFYFDTKAGFCEHYASSFAFLMRAAKIPARLVTGYLGAEYNPQGGYYSVFQYDAHAWTEVWLKGEGWVRIDPTAAVSPDRVEQGMTRSFRESYSLNANGFFSGKYLREFPLINFISMQLQAIDYQWTKWIIGYSIDKQLNLFSRLFGEDKLLKGAIFSIVVLLFMVVVMWLLNELRSTKAKILESIMLYNKALSLLNKVGIDKPKHMSPSEFCTLVESKRADLSIEFTAFSKTFESMRYKTLSQEEKNQSIDKMKFHFKKLKRLT